MAADSNSRDEIVRYLTGTMSEDERSTFEDRILGDDDLFERVVATEGDLLDAYARGEMSTVERSRLEKGVLSTPEGRTRLAFARALADRVSTTRPMVSTPPAETSTWARILEWTGANRTVSLAALTVAALVLVAVVLWASQGPRRLVALPEQVRQEPDAVPERNSVEPPRIAADNPPPDSVNANAPPPKVTSPKREKSPAGSIIAFVFAPHTTRGVEELRVLHVPAGATSLRLRLDLATTGPGPYAAVLKTADGRPVLRRSGLTARRTGTGSRVTFDIGANGLAEDEYNLALVEPGSEEVVADYVFRIERE